MPGAGTAVPPGACGRPARNRGRRSAAQVRARWDHARGVRNHELVVDRRPRRGRRAHAGRSAAGEQVPPEAVVDEPVDDIPALSAELAEGRLELDARIDQPEPEVGAQRRRTRSTPRTSAPGERPSRPARRTGRQAIRPARSQRGQRDVHPQRPEHPPAACPACLTAAPWRSLAWQDAGGAPPAERAYPVRPSAKWPLIASWRRRIILH